MGGKFIVVAGAGGNIGSHFTTHLARMPEVDRVALVDRDVYEPRNGRNQDIVVPRDVGQSKAVLQAQRLKEIRPDMQVEAIHAPLESLPLMRWRADLVAGCLDSAAARQAVNWRVWRVGSPWVDSGVLGSEWLARVNVWVPAHGAPCLECGWGDADYALLEQPYPCDGPEGAPPHNGASSELGALAAAMLALECRKMLAGEFDRAAIGRQATLNARWHRHAVTSFRRNPRCRFDHATWPIQPLRCDTRATRLADLLALAESVRVAGQRFIRRLVCRKCCGEKRMFYLEGSLTPAARRCGACRQPMAAAGFDIAERLTGDLPADVLNHTLDEAGLRHGDVLLAGDKFLEISAAAEIENEKRNGLTTFECDPAR